MSDRLTAEPGTLGFLYQLLEVSQDEALAEALQKIVRRVLRRMSYGWTLEDGLDIGKWSIYPTRERTLHEIIDDLWPPGKTPSYRDPVKYDLYLQRQKKWRQEHFGWSQEGDSDGP